jgi:DNA (cytosine-5)-methyltransferase 1
MKVLNLYAGIGGNRKLWTDCEVTAVEWDEETAKVYSDYFPDDEMIVGDAHQYLLDHYKEFDFIWSSPPCPTHSRINYSQVREIDYPDMKLYQEIILLETWFKGKWVVENVIPYYTPLIPATEIDRHLFWSNFRIPFFEPTEKAIIRTKGENKGIDYFQKIFGFDILYSGIKDKRKALRNCVHPETGLHIFNAAKGIITKPKGNQTQIEF